MLMTAVEADDRLVVHTSSVGRRVTIHFASTPDVPSPRCDRCRRTETSLSANMTTLLLPVLRAADRMRPQIWSTRTLLSLVRTCAPWIPDAVAIRWASGKVIGHTSGWAHGSGTAANRLSSGNCMIHRKCAGRCLQCVGGLLFDMCHSGDTVPCRISQDQTFLSYVARMAYPEELVAFFLSASCAAQYFRSKLCASLPSAIIALLPWAARSFGSRQGSLDVGRARPKGLSLLNGPKPVPTLF